MVKARGFEKGGRRGKTASNSNPEGVEVIKAHKIYF
jgi:hypothetical protein